MVSQVVNLGLAGDVPRKERRTTGNVGECSRNPKKKGEPYITAFYGGFYVFNNPNRYFEF